MRAGIIRIATGGVLAAAALCTGLTQPAGALEVVLDDVAADRVERQRRFNRNELNLPGTPDLKKLDDRLAARGLAEGRPIYIRIFKAESELELWMQNSAGTFSQLASYPICHWYGSLGPKLKEGDKQSPEGFYTVGVRQTRLVGRWRKAFNLGFPNLYDRRLNRTGSYILIHGGCSSVGCFAMTDPVQNEIYSLAKAALAKGQERFSVHVFPFRMTPENMERYAGHDGSETWSDLKPAYDSFQRTRVPPRVALCGARYKIADGLPGEWGGVERRLPVLRPVAADSAAVGHGGPGDNWVAPACRFEDEDERIAHGSGRPAAASAITTASVAPAPAEVVTEAKEAAEPASARVKRSAPTPVAAAQAPVPSRASSVSSAAQRAIVHRRARSASRASRADRRAGADLRAPSSAGADGFGSSGLRGTQRISSHGG